VSADESNPAGEVEDFEPPEGVRLRRRGDDLTIELPAGGWRVAWLELRIAVVLGMVLALLSGLITFLMVSVGSPAAFTVTVIGILGLFWIIVFALLGDAWRRSRRRAVLDIVGGTLLVTWWMPGSKRIIEIERGNIRGLGVGPSGAAAGGEPAMALRVDLGEPADVGEDRRRVLELFKDRSVSDLRWIAAMLRQELEIERGEGVISAPSSR